MNLISKLLEGIHLLILLLVSIGGYIIPKNYVGIYLLILPFIILDWNDKDGLCFVTRLQNMVSYKSFNPKVKDKVEENFTYGLLSKFINIDISEKTFNFLLYVIIILSWFAGYYRLVNKHNIKLFPDNISKYITIFIITGWILVTIPQYYKIN